MFKRGGGVSAKNNGIVQGFDNGGSVLEDFRAAGLIKDVEKPRGLTTSDYLRIAAAGAQIMGAQPTGRSGFIGALQAASPALAGLGTDLATSSAARQAAYQDRLSDQDALVAQGIIADRDAALQKEIATLDKDEFERVLEKADELTGIIDDVDKTAKQKSDAFTNYTILMLREIGVDLEDYALSTLRQENPDLSAEDFGFEVLKLRIPELSGRLNILKEQVKMAEMRERQSSAEGGSVGMDDGGKVKMAMSDPSPEAERGDMLDNLARKYFKKPLSKLSDDEVIELEEMMDEMPLKLSDGGSTRAGDNEEKAAEDRMKMESGKFYIDEDGNLKRLPTKKPRQNTRPGMNEEIAADAARRAELNKRYGRAEGGTMTEAPQAPKESPLTFEELRARLPREVTDQVVRLLATSEAALLDFANIDTEQDIAIFNQKYNADLQLPTQVA